MGQLNVGKVRLAMDRGFWSAANINAMMREHYKFLIGARMSLSMLRKAAAEHEGELRTWENYDEDRGLFGMCVPHEWDYEEVRPRAGDTIRAKRRSYIYLFFSPSRKADDERALAALLKACSHELEPENHVEAHEEHYDRFFEVRKGRSGMTVTGNMDAMESAGRLSGYFALFSNEVMKPFEALAFYSDKDAIEKCFGNAKEPLDFRTPKVSTDATLDGKLFVLFVALILNSWLRRNMATSGLGDAYTQNSLVDELDTIERYERDGHAPRICEVTKKQRDIYAALGFEPLTTS